MTAPLPTWTPSIYDAAGPEKTVTEAGGETCTIFRPATLAQADYRQRRPIVIWGNGTTLRPENYAPMLTNLASWGFVVAAANTTNAGSGQEMLDCLNWLAAQNAKVEGPYAGLLDTGRVGASGHSQGGGGALMAGRNARIKAVAPVEPWTSSLGYEMGAETNQHGPILLLSGGNDTLAVPAKQQQPVWDNANEAVTWLTLKDATHFVPMRGGGVFTGAVTAWFRYQLMEDARAKALFEGPTCGYCTAPDWAVKKKGAL
jgi:dienelactone hydrolase